MRYTRKDIEKLGTILGIWAHPDDEAFTSAGLMATAVENGQRVVLVTATRGGQGGQVESSLHLADDLAKVREIELKASLRAVGIKDHSFLGYRDGELLPLDQEEATQKIVKILKEVKPDTVISFDSDGLTGHEDHKAVHRWVRDALASQNFDVRMLCAKENTQFYDEFGKDLDTRHDMYFNLECPDTVDREKVDVCFKLDESLKHIKLAAIKAHKSQTESLFLEKQDAEAIKNMCNYECFIEYKT